MINKQKIQAILQGKYLVLHNCPTQEYDNYTIYLYLHVWWLIIRCFERRPFLRELIRRIQFPLNVEFPIIVSRSKIAYIFHVFLTALPTPATFDFPERSMHSLPEFLQEILTRALVDPNPTVFQH